MHARLRIAGPGVLTVLLALAWGANSTCAGQINGALPQVPAARLGFDEARLRRIDEAVDRAVAGGMIPGAVVVVGRRGAIAHAHVAGQRAVEPAAQPMTRVRFSTWPR